MSDFSEHTGNFTSLDGLKIFYRTYRADNERAVMVISHGLGEHSGRYGNVIERFVPKGITVWALDHRGHGQSDGTRGHISDFSQYIEDLSTLVLMARKDIAQGMKCFLLGHSMGGLIALNFALTYPQMLDGVIASSPALGMTVKVPVVKRIMGKIMSLIRPELSLDNELDASKISHDQQVVLAYTNDPLVHTRVSARWFTEFLCAMETTNRMASKMEVPILMQVAGDDYLVNAQASRAFFEKLTVKDKTIHVYEGLYHEIYNETQDQRTRVLTHLETWLENHIT